MFALVTGMLQAVSPAEPSVAFDVDSPAYVAIRFVHSAVLTVLIGCVAFRLAVLPRFARREVVGKLDRDKDHDTDRDSDRNGDRAHGADEFTPQLTSWLSWSLIVLLLAHVARLAAQHRVYFEDGAWTMGTMRPLLWQSGWGLAWLIASASTVIAFAAVWRIKHEWRAGWWLLAASLLVLCWTMAMSGHPAAAPAPSVAMALDAMHIVGAGGWVGSLSVMMFIAVPAVLRSSGSDAHLRIAGLVAAFSPTALVFASLLAVTGALAGWRNVGSWSGLRHSEYGTLLLIKLALVAVIAGLGAVNWQRVLPQLGEPAATRLLRRGAVPELGAAVVVLVVTAMLVATAMPEL